MLFQLSYIGCNRCACVASCFSFRDTYIHVCACVCALHDSTFDGPRLELGSTWAPTFDNWRTPSRVADYTTSPIVTSSAITHTRTHSNILCALFHRCCFCTNIHSDGRWYYGFVFVCICLWVCMDLIGRPVSQRAKENRRSS